MTPYDTDNIAMEILTAITRNIMLENTLIVNGEVLTNPILFEANSDKLGNDVTKFTLKHNYLRKRVTLEIEAFGSVAARSYHFIKKGQNIKVYG